VDGQVLAKPHALEEFEHRHIGQRLALVIGEQVAGSLGVAGDDLQAGQRHDMGPLTGTISAENLNIWL
jgi:hypothetical protein